MELVTSLKASLVALILVIMEVGVLKGDMALGKFFFVLSLFLFLLLLMMIFVVAAVVMECP